jgi:tRNA pseudouridine55 synthase
VLLVIIIKVSSKDDAIAKVHNMTSAGYGRIEIFSADIVSADEAINEYCIDVHCSKGTYIRTLCADIGEALGCGAAMTYLCRSKTGMFDKENSITLDELQKLADEGHIENALISVDQLFEHLPAISLTKRQERLLTNGVRLEAAVEKFPASEGCEYRLYGAGGFLGIARAAMVDGVLLTVMTANFKEV